MGADDVRRLQGRLMAVETIAMLLGFLFAGHPGMVKWIVEKIREGADAPRFNEALGARVSRT